MSEIFISYARSTETEAKRIAEALSALGYAVWRDDELMAHQAYADVIEERLKSAEAVVAVWSADATKSQWVRAEAEVARAAGKLVQLSLDGTPLPLPFSQIHCADLTGWAGDPEAPGWKRVLASVAALAGPAESGDAHPGDPSRPAGGKPSLAVISFSNLSNDPEQQYFAEGMTEEIVRALARFKTLSVSATQAAGASGGKEITPQELGRRPGVRYVLEGSVRRAGERVRIAVKLVDAATGVQVWGDRFDEALGDVFELQDKVALSVAGVVLPAIRGSEARRLARRPLEHMGSYDLYLRAWSLYRAVSKPTAVEALALLERALDREPDFEQALGLAAAVCGLIVVSDWADDLAPVRRRCQDFVERALRAGGDDEVVLGNAALGLAYGLQDFDRAIPLVQRAIAQNPGYAVNWLNCGIILLLNGDLEEALEHLQTAARLDPISIVDSTRNSIAQVYFLQGRLEEALALLRQSSLATWTYYFWLAMTLARLGRVDEAKAALARSRELAPGRSASASVLRRPEHRRLVREALALAEGGAEASARRPSLSNGPGAGG